jgi:hypothetical protein
MPGQKRPEQLVDFAKRRVAPECSYAAIPNKKLGSELWGDA